MSIGKQLTDLRNKKGLTRVQLAEDLHIPMTTLRNYEQDQREPGHKFLVDAAQYFGVTTDYLLENEKSPVPEGTEDREKGIDDMEVKLRSLLLSLGLMPDHDLTAEDLEFLAHTIALIQAYFKK